MLALVACHKYVPVETSTPPVGEVIAFQISDQGRVALYDRLGPGVAVIEGRIVGTEDNNYLISVNRIEQLNGTSSRWSGEVMRLDRALVAQARRRELSKTRTLVFAGGITAAVGVLIASRGLATIFGQDDPDPPPEIPPESRIGRTIRP